MIGIDAHMIGDKSGGNETYCQNIINNFNTEQSKNIILFVNNDADLSKISFSGQIVKYKSHNAFIRNFVEIPFMMKKYKLELMQTQYFIPFMRFCPVVTIIHDISFEHFKDIFTKKVYMMQKALIPYAAKKSNRILTCSNYSKDDIADKYNINSNKIVLTYCAVSDEFKRLNLSENEILDIREKFKLPDKFILSVGNLQPRKNIKRLLEAFVKLKKEKDFDLKLVIVGKRAWMYDDIFSILKDNHLESEVILTDYVTNEELVKLYNLSQIFVYPSFFEGFGLPVLEAMSCGTPVATSNVSSLPEVVGDAGVMFDPFNVEEIAEAIWKLCSSLELRNKCISLGLKQCDKFSWKESSDIIYNTYMDVIKENK